MSCSRALGCLTLGLVLMFGANASAVVIVNGDLSAPGIAPDPFEGWTTYEDYDPIFGFFSFDRPIDEGDVALFDESGALGSSQMEQTFDLPDNALTLSFEFMFSSLTEGPDFSPVDDSFQVTLYDSLFNGLLPADPSSPALPAFFSVDISGQNPTPGSSSVLQTTDLGTGWTRVALDVSSLGALNSVTLEFLLNGFPDGHSTSVRVDNIELLTDTQGNVIPEPSSMLVFGVLFGCLFLARSREHWGCAAGRKRQAKVVSFRQACTTFAGLVAAPRPEAGRRRGDQGAVPEGVLRASSDWR